MKNYRDQTQVTRCANCNFCFQWSEHDEYPNLYCDFDSDRPLSGSCELNECPYSFNDNDADIWDEWAKEHLVSECGICDNYKPIQNGAE